MLLVGDKTAETQILTLLSPVLKAMSGHVNNAANRPGCKFGCSYISFWMLGIFLVIWFFAIPIGKWAFVLVGTHINTLSLSLADFKWLALLQWKQSISKNLRNKFLFRPRIMVWSYSLKLFLQFHIWIKIKKLIRERKEGGSIDERQREREKQTSPK